MSLIYQIIKPVVRPFAKGSMEKGMKDPAVFIKTAKAVQSKALPLEKLHKKYDFDEKVAAGTPYYPIHSRVPSGSGIILYFFGGGYCRPGDAGDFEFGQDMADKTGKDVWLVWYPLFPDATGYDIAKAAADVYEQALKESPAEEISFYGNSSGGALCITACVFLKKYRPEIPLPGKIVSCSPSLRVPPTTEEQEKMNAQDHLDALIPAGLMRAYIEYPDLFRAGEFEEFASPIEQSWKGYPKMLILFGTDEVFLAYLHALLRKRREEELDLEIYVGKGCHCFPAAGFLPEAKPGRKKIYEFLNE